MKRFFFVALCASVIFTLGADSQDAELVAREKAESVLWCQLQDGRSNGEYHPEKAWELYSQIGDEEMASFAAVTAGNAAMTAALRAPVDVFNPCQRARIAELAAEHARTDLALQAIDWYIKAGLDEYQNGKIVLYAAQFAEHNKDYEIEEFLRGFIEMTGEGDPVFKYLLECLYERHASP